MQDLLRRAATELDDGEFLAGANDGVVGADLQTRLKAITEAGDTKLQSVQSLPVTPNGLIKYVGARIELIGTLAAIQRAIGLASDGTGPAFAIGGVQSTCGKAGASPYSSAKAAVAARPMFRPTRPVSTMVRHGAIRCFIAPALRVAGRQIHRAGRRSRAPRARPGA